jgi:TPR repeat protein
VTPGYRYAAAVDAEQISVGWLQSKHQDCGLRQRPGPLTQQSSNRRARDRLQSSQRPAMSSVMRKTMRILFSIALAICSSLAAGAELASARAAFNSGDHATALSGFQDLAKGGDHEAEFYLGLMTYAGLGVPADKKAALEWFSKSAEAGNAKAQNNLGALYQKGDGVAADPKQAVDWYTKAADQGMSMAMQSLGYMYYKGEGVEQSYDKAVEWWNKAAERGDAQAKFNLGLMYFSGRGVKVATAKGIKLWREAAELGNAEAQSALGNVFFNGTEVDQDFQAAYMWFRLATAFGKKGDDLKAQMAAQRLKKKELDRAEEEAQQKFEVIKAGLIKQQQQDG